MNPASAFPYFNSFFCSQPLTLESPAGEDGEMNTDPAFSFLPKLPPLAKRLLKFILFPYRRA
jgi:hypothetical protein